MSASRALSKAEKKKIINAAVQKIASILSIDTEGTSLAPSKNPYGLAKKDFFNKMDFSENTISDFGELEKAWKNARGYMISHQLDVELVTYDFLLSKNVFDFEDVNLLMFEKQFMRAAAVVSTRSKANTNSTAQISVTLNAVTDVPVVAENANNSTSIVVFPVKAVNDAVKAFPSNLEKRPHDVDAAPVVENDDAAPSLMIRIKKSKIDPVMPSTFRDKVSKTFAPVAQEPALLSRDPKQLLQAYADKKAKLLTVLTDPNALPVVKMLNITTLFNEKTSALIEQQKDGQLRKTVLQGKIDAVQAGLDELRGPAL